MFISGSWWLVRNAPRAPSTTGAQAVRHDRGDFLHAFTQTERVRSNKPVTLIRGADRFTADAMEYDNVEQVLQMRGRVHGVLMPKTGR